MNNGYPDIVGALANVSGLTGTVVTGLLLVTALWTIVWKGFGLWRAARNQQKYWVLAMLIINDLGIIEIIYLLWFRSDKKSMMPQSQPAAPVTVPPTDVA